MPSALLDVVGKYCCTGGTGEEKVPHLGLYVNVEVGGGVWQVSTYMVFSVVRFESAMTSKVVEGPTELAVSSACRAGKALWIG